MSDALRPGAARLLAQEANGHTKSPVRDIQAKLDAAIAGNPDEFALPGVVSETGLDLPPGLTFEQWQRVGNTLMRIDKAWKFWYGDWLRYGEREYGEMYSQAISDTGMDYRQLAQIAHVARRIEPDMRHESLSWSTHAAVAKLPRDAAIEVLDAAERDGLSRQEVRSAVKAITSAKNIPPAETLSSSCLCHCHASSHCSDCGRVVGPEGVTG